MSDHKPDPADVGVESQAYERLERQFQEVRHGTFAKLG